MDEVFEDAEAPNQQSLNRSRLTSRRSSGKSILKHSDSNPFSGYEVILDDEGNGQIIQSEAVLTTLEVDEENPGDPSLIIHVPKDETGPEKHNRTVFWASLLAVILVIGVSCGVGFGFLIPDEPVDLTPQPTEFVNVTLSNGAKLIGSLHSSYNDTVEFKNVPYAELLSNRNRFRPSRPIEEMPPSLIWNTSEPLETTCVQQNGLGVENCLYLSIYMQADILRVLESKEAEIVFYLHGGDFKNGDRNRIDGAFLASKQRFVVVTVNYRLGPFGYFNMKRDENMTKNEEYNPRGNWALRDQLLALEFLRDEAQNFGADRNKITLVGCGSGAQSIGFHLINSRLESYFKNAILLSPNFGIPVQNKTGYLQSGKITQRLDCCGSDPLDLQCLYQGSFNYTCLKKAEIDDILHFAYSDYAYEPDNDIKLPMPPYTALIEPFFPTFEPDYIKSRVVLGNPFTLLRQLRTLRSKVVLEITGREGQRYIQEILSRFNLSQLSPGDYDLILTGFFKDFCGGSRIDECAYLKNQIIQHYPCNKSGVCNQSVVNFFQDLLWTCNQRQVLNELESETYGIYNNLTVEGYECAGEYLLFGSNIDGKLANFQNQYIQRYSQLIINGTISADPWTDSKNWLYINPMTSNHIQTDWNFDATTEIYQNCAFLDQLELDFGIYLKK